MQFRKALSILLTLAGMAAFAPSSHAQSPLFETLRPAQPVEGGGKVEVTEFFWYGCPHCYSLEPYINAWLKNKPQDVVFKRVPTYNDNWAPMVSLYYTLEAMGLTEQYHQKVFDAIHKNNVNFHNKGKRDEWLKANGIDPAKFAEVEKSFTVATKVQRAKQLSQDYKVDGVPRVFVNGKYFTSPELAGGAERTFLVVDQLVATARKEKS
ncbi:MAG TPA: thiol:disulfide interchange protein DsbA/DsbL [Usitatibacter sp.]|nr:thiol:disulfide interchange protein DsbA/DsbL [Usitatibacter sp.]